MDKPIDDAAFWEMVSLLDEAERLIDTKDFEPALENSEQVIDDVEELIVVDAQPPGHLWRVVCWLDVTRWGQRYQKIHALHAGAALLWIESLKQDAEWLPRLVRWQKNVG